MEYKSALYCYFNSGYNAPKETENSMLRALKKEQKLLCFKAKTVKNEDYRYSIRFLLEKYN